MVKNIKRVTSYLIFNRDFYKGKGRSHFIKNQLDVPVTLISDIKGQRERRLPTVH